MMVNYGGERWVFGRERAGFVWKSQTPRAQLLLQHGYGEYAGRYVAGYHQLIPHLTEIGFDVYAFDVEGHGHSPGKRGVANLKVALEDHAAARRQLSAQDKPLFLFGHSLGGLITAVSVAREDEGVSGVILSAPALQIDLSPPLRLAAKVLSALAPAARATPPIPPESLSRIPEEVATYRADPLICRQAPSARLGATALTVSEDGWQRYRDWKTPVLILHGDQDTAASLQGSERFSRMIASEDRHLEIFSGGYHELLNDLERDRARGLMLDWLQKRLPFPRDQSAG